VRGQQGWSLATKGVPGGCTGPVPVITPNQLSRIGVCWGGYQALVRSCTRIWNAGLASGKLLGEADVAKVLEGVRVPSRTGAWGRGGGGG